MRVKTLLIIIENFTGFKMLFTWFFWYCPKLSKSTNKDEPELHHNFQSTVGSQVFAQSCQRLLRPCFWSPSIICLNVLCVILCRESQRTVLQSASWRGCEYSTWSDSCVFMFNISSTEPVRVRNTLFFSRWSIATSPCTTWHQLYVSPISLMPHEKGHVNLFSSMSLYQMGFCYFAEQ